MKSRVSKIWLKYNLGIYSSQGLFEVDVYWNSDMPLPSFASPFRLSPTDLIFFLMHNYDHQFRTSHTLRPEFYSEQPLKEEFSSI